MSDERWMEVDLAAASATDHFTRAGEIFRRVGMYDESMEGYVSRMAFMHAMLSAHTSLENTLLRLLEILNEEAPGGSQWHADLIIRAGRATSKRPAILSSELVRAADRTPVSPYRGARI